MDWKIFTDDSGSKFETYYDQDSASSVGVLSFHATSENQTITALNALRVMTLDIGNLWDAIKGT